MDAENDPLGLVKEIGNSEIAIRSLSKNQIEEYIGDLIESNLEFTDSASLYIMLKQLEHGIEFGLEMLRERAFDAAGSQLGGLTQGDLLGHKVGISYPATWQYSPVVDDLKSRQKAELDILQEAERNSGIARKVQGRGRITVTLNSGR